MVKWIAFALVAAAAGALQDAPSYLGKEPPELVSEKDQWLGTDQAWKLLDLKSKVVWLEFGVLG